MFRSLIVYQKSYQLAKRIHEIVSRFPSHEIFALTSQLRKSSRSVCANLAEAYERRNYRKHFLSKISDCIAENNETLVWLDFAKDFGYIKEEDYEELALLQSEVARLLYFVSRNPDKFMPITFKISS